MANPKGHRERQWGREVGGTLSSMSKMLLTSFASEAIDDLKYNDLSGETPKHLP
jgi:hypothetical protein